jgi:hypothetical protein
VELDRGVLTVRATLKRSKGMGLVLDQPKTERRHRVISCQNSVLQGFATAIVPKPRTDS